MKKILLHIGTGKTGTTSIQHTLDKAARDQALGTIAYPRLKGRDHNFLSALYRQYEDLPRQYRSRYAERRALLSQDVATFSDGLRQAIRDHDEIVLSGEYLSQFTADQAQRFMSDLADLGVNEIGVVVYVRNPASRYLSWVGQRLKAAASFASPAEFKDMFMDVLDVWGGLSAKLVVRPFERQQLYRGDVVRDFLLVTAEFFGRDFGAENVTVVPRNESLSAEAMIVMQRYRESFYPDDHDVFKADSDRLYEMLETSKGELPQTTPRLKREVAHIVMERHAEDLSALWRRYGVDLREGHYGGDEKPPTPRQSYVELHEILESYDEATVQHLLLDCLRRTLSGD